MARPATISTAKRCKGKLDHETCRRHRPAASLGQRSPCAHRNRHYRHDGDGSARLWAPKGHTEIYRGAEYTIAFLPKLKVEVALPDERVEDAIAAITKAARTGRIGDGKIFVLDIVAARRVRTGETGDDAL